jgi:hypothetical protein
MAAEAPVEAARPLVHEEPAVTPSPTTELIPPPVIATPTPAETPLQPAPTETPYNEEPTVAAPPAAEPTAEPAEPAYDPVAEMFQTPAPAAAPTPTPAAPTTEQPAAEVPAQPTFVAPTTPSEVTPAPAATEPPVTTPPAGTPAPDATPETPPQEPSSPPAAGDLFDLGSTLRTLDEKGGWASDAMRTWTDTTGKFACTARLVAASGETVTLVRADGREVQVPYHNLSRGDLAFVHRQIIARRAAFAAEGQTLVVSPRP